MSLLDSNNYAHSVLLIQTQQLTSGYQALALRVTAVSCETVIDFPVAFITVRHVACECHVALT